MEELGKEDLTTRFHRIRDEIAAIAKSENRTTDLIAVSKTNPFEKIEALYEAGQRDFGENYVQEMIEKATLAKERGLTEIRWHFIGHLQTNKVKSLLPFTTLIHTVDRMGLVEEISKRNAGEKISVLLEVNIDEEESKSGLTPKEIPDFLTAIRPFTGKISFDGWMCIPKPTNEEGALISFRKMREISKTYASAVGRTLSMGMSSDFKLAISEGSSYVRIGTAIFGDRKK